MVAGFLDSASCFKMDYAFMCAALEMTKGEGGNAPLEMTKGVTGKQRVWRENRGCREKAECAGRK